MDNKPSFSSSSEEESSEESKGRLRFLVNPSLFCILNGA
jgi:hypothetical protein